MAVMLHSHFSYVTLKLNKNVVLMEIMCSSLQYILYLYTSIKSQHSHVTIQDNNI